MQNIWENQNFKIFSTFSNPKVVHQSKWICLRRFCQILGLIANPDLIRPVAICFKDCIYQSNIFGNNTMIPFMYFYEVFIYEGNFRLPLNVSIICKYILKIYIFVREISLKCFFPLNLQCPFTIWKRFRACKNCQFALATMANTKRYSKSL